MATLAPSETSWSAERYFELADQGVLGPDDRVELLEGVIVAMAPHTPEHASGVTRALKAVGRAIGERATSRVQLPLVAGPRSVPESPTSRSSQVTSPSTTTATRSRRSSSSRSPTVPCSRIA